MANEAKVESIITLFPTEISAVIGTSDAYKTVSNTPGTYDKWYYNKHAVPSDSGGTDIISGTFLESVTKVETLDEIKFLYIVNLSEITAVYIALSGKTASSSLADAIFISPGEYWFSKFTSLTVGNLHAVSSAGSVDCGIAAIIKDVSEVAP
tara:strand:- start:176 stop:631 length:456 start_codon:yes stop_codon:yes gene_type:complete